VSARSVPEAVDLPPLPIAPRLDRLRRTFAEANCDALVITRLVNIRYLTGFTGSAAMLLVKEDDALFVTDGRYTEQAEEQLGAAGVDARIEIGANQTLQRDSLMGALGTGHRIGLEADGVTWSQAQSMTEWFAGNEVVSTTGLVEGLRRVKDDAEVARIRAACAIADDALAELLPTLADGPTEREFALALEFAMRRRGASANSFDPIVASGPNAAKPHARPSDRRVGEGELVVLDFGCIVDGYCSDMTRTVSVGDPGPEARSLVDVVATAQRAGRDEVRAGITAGEVDATCRSVIDDAGLGEYFVHGTGHGVGLEIHEAPRVGKGVGDTLEPGFIVTVEPGVYVAGRGGVRIEDTVVVTETGCTPLTLAPKDLIV